MVILIRIVPPLYGNKVKVFEKTAIKTIVI